jgi:glyoxylase-like metal-dependent hydrolase (beta-lactamase superfamily II)
MLATAIRLLACSLIDKSIKHKSGFVISVLAGDNDMKASLENVLSTAERIDVGEPWFTVLKLPHRVYAISEPKHHEMVISFLIIGTQKSILFDTGMGIKDISRVVGQLTNDEVIVVNSHVHFDHVGDNFRFSDIYMFNHEPAIERLVCGWPIGEIHWDAEPENFTEGYPDGFDPASYAIHPIDREKIHPIHDGDVLDIGDRKLQVLHTPGHSPDSIMLLDRENRALFTGDTFYPDWLYAFMSGTWGESNLHDYYATLQRISELVPELEYLFCSHVKALAEPQVLLEVAKAIKTLLDKSETNHEAVVLYGQDCIVHHFDGFSIVTKKEW